MKTKIFGSINKGLDIIDQAVEDKDAKRDAAMDLIKSEMADGDNYSKRARPTVIYAGIIIIFLEVLGLRMWGLTWMEASEATIKMSTDMLQYFFFTWGGIVAAYSVGKSYEKAKIKGILKK